MGSLEDLIAEAARLANRTTFPTFDDGRRPIPQRPQPDLSALVAEAHGMVKQKARTRERQRRAEAYDRQVENMSSLWARTAGEREKQERDCIIRAEAVRGIPAFEMGSICRLTFDEWRPGTRGPERTPHVHGGRAPCVYVKRCFRCGEALNHGQRRWCSQTCSNLWWTNHMWAMARAAALKRDKHTCVRCGKKEGALVLPGVCSVDGESWPCLAGLEVEQTRGAVIDRGVFATLPGGKQAFHQPVDRLIVALEVNHIVPLVGRGYDQGCVHHLDGLETLCHDCHVDETTRQIRERKAARG